MSSETKEEKDAALTHYLAQRDILSTLSRIPLSDLRKNIAEISEEVEKNIQKYCEESSEEDPKKTLYVDISGACGVGKTTLALVLKHILESLGLPVQRFRDPDYIADKDFAHKAKMLEAFLRKQKLAPKSVVIRTRQLGREPKKDVFGEIIPGKLLPEKL